MISKYIPSNPPELSPEEDLFYAVMRAFHASYALLKRDGISEFLPGGDSCEMDGVELIDDLLWYAEHMQWYERCAVLLKLQNELKEGLIKARESEQKNTA